MRGASAPQVVEEVRFMTADPNSWDLLTASLVLMQPRDPWEQWAFLMSQRLLRDEPSDRETAIRAIEEEAEGEETEAPFLASRVAATLRTAGVVLAAAATPDPQGKTAKERRDRLQRRAEWWEACVQPLLDAEWKNLGASSPDVSWDSNVSPAFPADWPAESAGQLFYYAYPVGRDHRSHDALHVLGPWARVEVAEGSGEGPKLTPFQTRIVPGRVAHLRPRLTFHELTSLELGRFKVETFEVMLKASQLPDEGAPETRYLKDFYSTWHRSSLVRGIRSHHEPFFGWLGLE